MNQNKLQDCSPTITKTLENLEEFYSEVGEYKIRHAPAIWTLDRFDSEKSTIFLEKFGEDLSVDLADYLLLEYGRIFTPLYRLFIENQKPENCSDHIKLILQTQKQKQEFSGGFVNYHPNLFRSLVHIAPDSEATQRARDYFIKNFHPEQNPVRGLISGVSGVLGLIELNYNKYEEMTGEWLQEIASEIVGEGRSETLDGGTISAGHLLEASTKHRSYSLPQEVITTIEEDLVDYCDSFNQHIENSGFDELASNDFYTQEKRSHGAVMLPAFAVNSLTAIGHGYNVSGYEREWENQLKEKEQERTRSEFVSTLPAMEMWERKRGIQRKAESMISSTENELRIASLRIDMLHEDLIDIAESDEEIEIKILTNTGSSRGERRKMANAVINELARRTEGNVHEHQLVHARIVIADDRELLVSSADLTRDQLADEFNGGIYTRDPDAVQQAIDAFDEIWNSGHKLDPSGN
ncbi:hypothetical protein J2744_000706 [Halorubrum trapanicum]|uniref:PLD phosphodiesterase domain-containing protein n=1 Tax=Halorubrum trapanicum TaxID=29284 RepID=A0A8J7RBR4_9EURY|nr:phospholipase D-like domain-containing protein [Halorubrum trapanicum]MBP1901048.1 hypothetical protein [Halorubrum trapanicum]